jgi:CAP-Gly domain-containing linker protein 1
LSPAAEIDNEALCEQIHHLQRKVATLEDALEEAHVATEREEAITRERMRRFKEKEELMRKEFGEGRRELELSQKSEASARRRVEEVEDALRESTGALENARAELEVLRAECAVSLCCRVIQAT